MAGPLISDDDLSRPLGQGRTEPPRRLPPVVRPLAAAFAGAGLVLFAAWGFIHYGSLGGAPKFPVSAGVADAASKMPPAEVTSAIPAQIEVPPATARNAAAAEPAAQPAPPDRPEHVVTIIDGRSGTRQEVRIPGPAGASANAPAASTPAASGETRLIEMTHHGPIPRIGADGLRAAQAYARPIQAKPNSPQIAIVVSGLGISPSVTAEALNKLPGPVTLALMPHGAEVGRLAAKARNLGHELLLQVPMEPADYPNTDPGPQTLVTTLTTEQNIDRLQWAMSRFPAYVGVANRMGARFTATEASFAPIMREIGQRGLIYVDDGSSPRSLASQLAGGSSVAFAKANLTLDSVPSAVEIDRALARLEAMARDNGIAVGFASALPMSIERIAVWAKSAEGRGFTLVPITAAAARTKSS
jgi:uncharacterized protein